MFFKQGNRVSVKLKHVHLRKVLVKLQKDHAHASPGTDGGHREAHHLCPEHCPDTMQGQEAKHSLVMGVGGYPTALGHPPDGSQLT